MVEMTQTPSVNSVASAGGSYVEWGAVIAGGVMATAISFVLLTFGAAIGLSFTSPWQQERGLSASGIASLAVYWTLAQQIGAAMAGGYIAGRMRIRWADASKDEVEFRDGLHGGLVWALGVLLGSYLVLSAAGSAVKTASDIAGRAASAAAYASADPLAYQIDALLRPSTGQPRAAAAPAGTPAGSQTDVRTELMRIFSRSILNNGLAERDRSYLIGLVAQRSGISAEEAEKRVQSAYAEASAAAKEAADKARRAGILGGFVVAAGLLISLAAAWWSAIRGGFHRDNDIPARFSTRWSHPKSK